MLLLYLQQSSPQADMCSVPRICSAIRKLEPMLPRLEEHYFGIRLYRISQSEQLHLFHRFSHNIKTCMQVNDVLPIRSLLRHR